MSKPNPPSLPVSVPAAHGLLRRWGPLALLALGLVVVLASGAHRAISFDAIALRYGDMQGLLAAQPLATIVGAVLLYGLVVALSLPAAWLMTIAMGLLFGWQLGSLVAVLGATLGASLLFLAARTAFADFFASRFSGTIARLSDGFARNAVSYLLFLRLAPVVPFTLLNIVPALLGVPFRTFVWTTAVGIVPGTLAYAYAGEGLRSIVAERAQACMQGVAPCGQALTPGDIVTPQILIAFALLAVVSLVPVVLKRFVSRQNRPQA